MLRSPSRLLRYAALVCCAALARADEHLMPWPEAAELSPLNYTSLTASKLVMLKFEKFPGYPNLRESFARLSNESRQDVLVASVFCDRGGKPICDYLQIAQFPTLVYGDPWDLKNVVREDFEAHGGKADYAGLSGFIKEKVRWPCSAMDPTLELSLIHI